MANGVRVFVMAGLLAAVGGEAWGQKKVMVKLTHPAKLGAALAGKRVLGGQATGECAKEWAELVLEDMKRSGVLVETGLGVEAARAAESEKKLGAAVVLDFQVARCEARRREAMLGSGLPAPHISRVEGKFEARVIVRAAGSGKELETAVVKAEAAKENSSETGVPEYPDQEEVKKMALLKGALASKPLHLPWTEMRELGFYDAKECGMKAAYELLKSGDAVAARKQAQAEIEGCTGKSAAQAWYNLGVLAWAVREYEAAGKAWDEARKGNGKAVPAELYAECRRDFELTEGAKPKAERPVGEAQTGILMTNDFVLKMKKADVSEAEMVRMVKTQPGRFDVSEEALTKLREAGVPEAVVVAMKEKR